MRSRLIAKLIGGSMPPERMVRECLEQLDRGLPLLVPDFVFPINRIGIGAGLLVQMSRSPLLTVAASRFFELLLDGEEVKRNLHS